MEVMVDVGIMEVPEVEIAVAKETFRRFCARDFANQEIVIRGTGNPEIVVGEDPKGAVGKNPEDVSVEGGDKSVDERCCRTEAIITVKDVTIGKGFHWQRKEMQKFRGILILRSDGEKISVINRIPLEVYLESVVSSEMNANASIELLKAHAVISRTWVMARIFPNLAYSGIDEAAGKSAEITISDKHSGMTPSDDADGMVITDDDSAGMVITDDERIVWYDSSLHHGFHVCADDHCQRYQGVTRILNRNAIEAVQATKGVILAYDGKICDARFSKCCGGMMETFENCWQPVNHPYLVGKRDSMDGNGDFCNTSDPEVLSQILNDYDLATKDFYRWTKEYSQEEISSVIRNRSGIDFGDILDIVPIKRGVSGRILKAKIVGTGRSMTVGKELEIRRWLSDTHLYSSAFEVEKVYDIDNDESNPDKIPGRFILHGAGWGHGVGLCQIGAAMMARKGYDYRQILRHYYPGSSLSDASTLDNFLK